MLEDYAQRHRRRSDDGKADHDRRLRAVAGGIGVDRVLEEDEAAAFRGIAWTLHPCLKRLLFLSLPAFAFWSNARQAERPPYKPEVSRDTRKQPTAKIPPYPSRGVQLGKNILRLIEGKKLTQEKVAEDAGVSWRYLQELESGKGANPSLNVLCGLKVALDCSWDELLAGLP